MTPAELRARVLLALGLPGTALAFAPGCKAPPPEAPVVAVESDAGGARTDAAAEGPATAARTCGLDEVLESVCGHTKVLQRYPFERCADANVNVSSSRHLPQRLIEPNRVVRDRAELASFTFDPEETREQLVASLHIPPEALANAKYGTSMCCFTKCTRLEVTRTVDPVPAGHEIDQTCIPALRTGTSVPAEGRSQCPAAIRLRGRAVRFDNGNKDLCCYATTRPACPPGAFRTGDGECHHHNRGRPFREEGRMIAAPTRTGEGWADDALTAPCDGVRAEVRASLAAEWAQNAAAEHASVAAFARLSLELLALGAPADLVAACHVAAIEEVEHARLSYGIASRFAGEPLGPGPLAFEGGARTISLVDLAAETFEDGCIGETVAALEAEEARALAADGSIARVLETIARDEGEHATLGFRILSWALRSGGSPVRDRIMELVARAERASDDAMRAHALRAVVLPCTRALLASDSSSRDDKPNRATPAEA